MLRTPTMAPVVGVLAALLVLVAPVTSALACPACAGGADDASTLTISLLLAAPLAGFTITALVVWRVLRRARS